jgi:L-threonylcarbamoyladenylate synthase
MTRLDAHDPQSVTRAADALRSGAVVAYPTDTLYGLAVDPRSDDAVERLFAAKGRERGMAVPIIASGLAQAQMAGAFGPRELRLAEVFWPGPLSIVIPAARVMSRSALGGKTTIAVRVPSHAVARALATVFGFCITATSANLSGAPATASPDVVAATFEQQVDVLLDAGPAPGGPPSTLVGFDETGPVLIRAGAIAWERVLKSLE